MVKPTAIQTKVGGFCQPSLEVMKLLRDASIQRFVLKKIGKILQHKGEVRW